MKSMMNEVSEEAELSSDRAAELLFILESSSEKADIHHSVVARTT